MKWLIRIIIITTMCPSLTINVLLFITQRGVDFLWGLINSTGVDMPITTVSKEQKRLNSTKSSEIQHFLIIQALKKISNILSPPPIETLSCLLCQK